MKKILKGNPGLTIGIIAIMVDAVIALILSLRMCGILTTPPKAPYSVTYLLWFMLGIAIWVLVAHTTVGDRKIGRVIAGIFTALSIFSGIVGYLLTWIAMTLYWPVLKMDLGWTGVASTLVYEQIIMWVFFVIFLAAFSFILYNLLHSPAYWKGFLNWRIGNLTEDSLVMPREDKLDIIICIDAATKLPVVIREEDLTLNILVQGPIGAGKTSQVLKPILAQILTFPTAGATVIEPKGSFAKAAYLLAKESGKYSKFIDPENINTDIFNPLEGDDPDIVAAVNDAMLSALFGKQDPFFGKIQSVVNKNVILLLKYVRGDDCTFEDLYMLLLDTEKCKQEVLTLKHSILKGESEYSPKNDLVNWFNMEMFGKNEKEIRKFSIGLRVQIGQLLSNVYMRRCLVGKSTINMDHLLENGGFLAVSTHDGLLKDLSKALGMVVLGHLQAAVERRPLPVDKTNANLKPPLHMIMMDEFGSYVNESFGNFITKVREYNAPIVLAFQALSQMEEVGQGNNQAFREKIVGSCRSKIIFPDIPLEDAIWYSNLSAKGETQEETTTIGTSSGKGSWFMPDSYRQGVNTRNVETAKVSYTAILYGKANTVFYRVLQERKSTNMRLGLVDFFDRDFSDRKLIILPRKQFWFDESEFQRRIAKRVDKLEKIVPSPKKVELKAHRVDENQQSKDVDSEVEGSAVDVEQDWFTRKSLDKAEVRLKLKNRLQ